MTGVNDELYKHCCGDTDESCDPLLIYYHKVTIATAVDMIEILLLGNLIDGTNVITSSSCDPNSKKCSQAC